MSNIWFTYDIFDLLMYRGIIKWLLFTSLCKKMVTKWKSLFNEGGSSIDTPTENSLYKSTVVSDSWEAVSDIMEWFSQEKIDQAFDDVLSFYNEMQPKIDWLMDDMPELNKAYQEWIDRFKANPRTKDIPIETVLDNASKEVSDKERTARAVTLLWRELSESEMQWILDVHHNMFPEKWVFELSVVEWWKKVQKLIEYWFTKEEAYKLCDYWICWWLGSAVNFVAKTLWKVVSLPFKSPAWWIALYYYLWSKFAEELYYGTFDWWNDQMKWTIMLNWAYLLVYLLAFLGQQYKQSWKLSWESWTAFDDVISQNTQFILAQSAAAALHFAAEIWNSQHWIYYKLSDMPMFASGLITFLTFVKLRADLKQGSRSGAEKDRRQAN